MAQVLQFKSIVAPAANCPLIEYSNNVRICHLPDAPVPLFDPRNPPTHAAALQSTPIPIGYSGHDRAKIIVTIEWKDAGPPAGPTGLRLSIYGNGSELAESIEIVRSAGRETTQSFELPLVGPVVGGSRRDLPWRFGGKGKPSSITIKRTAGDITIAEAHVALEIYVLFSPLPPYFTGGGVPIALLRMDTFLGPWLNPLAASDDPDRPLAADDFPACVVKALFRDPRLTYNSADAGAAMYLINKKLLYLDLFLSDIGTPKSRKYPVNCYDLAGLVSVISSLGVDYRKMQMAYMKPFGFLQPSRLIGDRILMNSPFYAARPRGDPPVLYPLCDDNHTKLGYRSTFGDHVFIISTHDGREAVILDSTSGPQIGDTTLANYPAAVLDPSPYTLAAKYPGERINLGTALTANGTIDQIRVLPGVISLQPTIGLFDPKSGVSAPLIKRMKEAFEGSPTRGVEPLGTLYDPVVTVQLQNSAGFEVDNYPCISWTLLYRRGLKEAPAMVNIQASIVSLDLSQEDMFTATSEMRKRYQLASLSELLKRRWDGLGSRPAITWNTVPVVRETHAEGLFADPEANAVVYLRCDKRDLTIINIVEARMKEVLKVLHEANRKKDPLQKPTIRGDVKVDPPGLKRVGSTFTVTVRVEEHDKGYGWLGYSAYASKGGVILLDAVVSTSLLERNNVTFKFLVRDLNSGVDEIFIELFDFALAVQRREVTVALSARPGGIE